MASDNSPVKIASEIEESEYCKQSIILLFKLLVLTWALLGKLLLIPILSWCY